MLPGQEGPPQEPPWGCRPDLDLGLSPGVKFRLQPLKMGIDS